MTPLELRAMPGRCEEASILSKYGYIPCNKPATQVIAWRGRYDRPCRMCDMCADHNINNRGGYKVSDIDRGEYVAVPAD